eukprot:m.123980 g.123980  ORF g.123980 m.123980 type:complete len:563 (+) comp11139_c3_seq1:529-2217(+)
MSDEQGPDTRWTTAPPDAGITPLTTSSTHAVGADDCEYPLTRQHRIVGSDSGIDNTIAEPTSHAAVARRADREPTTTDRHRQSSTHAKPTFWGGVTSLMFGDRSRRNGASTGGAHQNKDHDSAGGIDLRPIQPAQADQEPPRFPPLIRGTKIDDEMYTGMPGEAVPGRGTKIDVLSSQELLISADGSCALDHRSYSPANFYPACYQHEPINMDRGSFGHCSNKTNFGCVFDGVTAGGKINAYAAQAFAEYTYKFLVSKHKEFRQGTGVNELLARQMFAGAIDRANNPATRSGKFEAEGGSATGIFIMFEPCGRDDYVIANGASIGDTAAILCYAERCECRVLSTTGFRRSDNARDTGGQLSLGMGINGEIWNFSSPVGVDDLVILCTDGLTDNLRSSDLSVLLPIVIRSSAFDAYPPEVCPCVFGDKPSLPRVADVLKYTGHTHESDFDGMPLPEPAVAVLRLSHYIAWVTMALSELENRYYGAELLCRDEMDKKDKLLRSSTPSLMFEDPPAALAQATASIDALTEEQKDLHASRKTKYVGKTDDAIIVVMKPMHTFGIKE